MRSGVCFSSGSRFQRECRQGGFTHESGFLPFADLAPLGQAYSEVPITDAAVAIRWNDAVFAGFLVSRDRILAITTSKDLGDKAAPDVIFSVRVCTGGDYCSEVPSLHTAARILRKRRGPKGTLLLLLSVGQVPPAKLTPYNLAETPDDDKVHFRINGIIPAEGKLSAEDEDGLRTVDASVKADCTLMIGRPMLQGAGQDQLAGDTVAGSVVGCDSKRNLQIVPANKLQKILSHNP